MLTLSQKSDFSQKAINVTTISNFFIPIIRTEWINWITAIITLIQNKIKTFYLFCLNDFVPDWLLKWVLGMLKIYDKFCECSIYSKLFNEIHKFTTVNLFFINILALMADY